MEIHTSRNVGELVSQLVSEKVASRLSAKDSGLWGEKAQAEAAVRLGWLDAPKSLDLLEEVAGLRAQLAEKGVTRFVLSGMGGSSLAPEVITRCFDCPLTILDTTDPDYVLETVQTELSRTALIVSSKSGGTVEVDSHRRLFEEHFRAAGIDPKERIVCVTDPGSPLDKLARELGYRVFNADPNVGGRFSALTAFGIVPAGLAGVDMRPLLESAAAALPVLAQDSADNPGLVLAALLALETKAALVCRESNIGDWVEQLLAESTGKEKTGILPIVTQDDSPVLAMPNLLAFRISLQKPAPLPSPLMPVTVSGDLGEQFILWEFATAVVGRMLRIDPFNQPDVESAKAATRQLLQNPAGQAQLERMPAGAFSAAGFFAGRAATVSGLLDLLGEQIPPTGYLAVQAYLSPVSSDLPLRLTRKLSERFGKPVTFGWGPRFLHSTGQYHKGGPLAGAYLQLVTESDTRVDIPGLGFDFGTLLRAQAAGDALVLERLGRPVLTIFVPAGQEFTIED